jgi:hypothetical protein
MGAINRVPSKNYYSNKVWDEGAWVKVIAVEYEQLIKRYPFERKLSSLARKGEIRLLDVGSGTAIFPSFLDTALSDKIRLVTDMLDMSTASLDKATKRLEGLVHFRPRQQIKTRIEQTPEFFQGASQVYDVIWAIHSFTTVDVQRMPQVYAKLIDLIAPSGYLFIYQLAARSSYQVLHGYYRENNARGAERSPFMEYEDSERIFELLGHSLETHELSFEHKVDTSNRWLLEKYLQKCVLDDSLQAIEFFSELLPRYLDESSRTYRFPQCVNLGVVRPG